MDASLNKTMEQLLWNIAEVFQIADRGLVITADIRDCDDCADVPKGLILQIRRPDSSRLNCPRFSIGFFDPQNRERPRQCFLSGDLHKDAVPIGRELWRVEPDGESELLALAHAYQQATGFHLRRPPMERVTAENAEA